MSPFDVPFRFFVGNSGLSWPFRSGLGGRGLPRFLGLIVIGGGSLLYFFSPLAMKDGFSGRGGGSSTISGTWSWFFWPGLTNWYEVGVCVLRLPNVSYAFGS